MSITGEFGLFGEKDMNHLKANCEKCFSLCCVALPFAASVDFAVNKDGGKPCSNLQSDFKCSIHKILEEKVIKAVQYLSVSALDRRFLKLHLTGWIGGKMLSMREKCMILFQLCISSMKCFGI